MTTVVVLVMPETPELEAHGVLTPSEGDVKTEERVDSSTTKCMYIHTEWPSAENRRM